MKEKTRKVEERRSLEKREWKEARKKRLEICSRGWKATLGGTRAVLSGELYRCLACQVPSDWIPPAAEITFSDRTWQRKRNAVQSQRKREQKGEGHATSNEILRNNATLTVSRSLSIHPPVPRGSGSRGEKRKSRSIFGCTNSHQIYI